MASKSVKSRKPRDVIGFLGLVVAIFACIAGYLALVPEEQRLSIFQGRASGKTIAVRGADWQNTGIYLKDTDTVIISYESGGWSNCQYDCPITDAKGILDSSPFDNSNVVEGCPHGALVARVIPDNSFTDIKQATGLGVICVGNSFTGTFPNSGYLQLSSNDIQTFDNTGSIIVRIELK